MAASSLHEMIFSGQRGRGLRLLLDVADGGSVVVSNSTVFVSAQRDNQPELVKLSGEIDI